MLCSALGIRRPSFGIGNVKVRLFLRNPILRVSSGIKREAPLEAQA